MEILDKEIALLYQKALITSLNKEVRQLQQELATVQYELQCWKIKKAEVTNINQHPTFKELQQKYDKLREPKMTEQEKIQVRRLRDENARLIKENKELVERLLKAQ